MPVTLKLPRPMHVVDMRMGRQAGPTRQFITSVRPWWPAFLTLSERKLQTPVLKAKGAASRGEHFVVDASVPDAQGAHALKIRARGPDGRDAPWFSRSVIVEKGRVKILLPIAHNEQEGAWTLTATDLLSGRSSEIRFDVRAANGAASRGAPAKSFIVSVNR